MFGIFFVYVFDMSPRWHFWRFGIHVCPIVDAFLGTFSEARLNLHVKHDMHENISIYYVLTTLYKPLPLLFHA